MIPVEVAPAADRSLRELKDAGAQPERCHRRAIRRAVAGTVANLVDGRLDGRIRPWDASALRRRAAQLDDVASARVLSVDGEVLVAQLHPGGERLVFRGTDDGWRLVRFADSEDCSLRPETSRRVALRGGGPDSVLEALGLTRPEDVELEVEATDLGQGETETRYTYRWTEGRRTVLAEEVTTEIFDGATPRSTHVRGLIVDGDRGVLLVGRDGSAEIVEG